MNLSADDFNQRYVGTFIRQLQPDKNLRLIHVDHIHIRSQHDGMVEITSLNDGSASLKYPACLSNLDLSQPDPGYFNLNNFALYFFRYPDRQWRRGISGKNAEFYNPLQLLLPDIRLYRPTLSFSAVNATFEKSFCPTIEMAIGALNNKHMSIALSSKLMLSLSPTTDVPYVLWWGCTPVGKFMDGVFKICDPIFEQEIFDEFRKLGIDRQWINF